MVARAAVNNSSLFSLSIFDRLLFFMVERRFNTILTIILTARDGGVLSGLYTVLFWDTAAGNWTTIYAAGKKDIGLPKGETPHFLIFN